MNLIVSADAAWGIGRDNQLLCWLRADMKYFKEQTTGHIVVMGRRTLESMPQRRPLPKRRNIVLSSQADYAVAGAEVAHSLTELAALLLPLPSEQIYIIGGASLYRIMLPFCRYASVTRLEATFAADRFFPYLDAAAGWRQFCVSGRREENGVGFRFVSYENIAVRDLRELVGR